MEVGLEVNTEKIKYTVMPHHENAGQNNNLVIANKFYENMAKFKHMVKIVMNQNCIHEEVKSKINLGDGCYHSVQNVLSYRPLTKNLKIKIYKTIILPVS